MNKGKLIVFEGISGTGKDTQGKLLASFLKEKNITARVVNHPSPGMRTILSTWLKERHIDDQTAVYLLLADRYDRVRQEITPALDKGEWVISTRSWLTALIYQGQKPEVANFIKHEFAKFEPKPDLILYFNISPDEAYRRINVRNDNKKGYFETLEKLKFINSRHQEVIIQYSHEAVDANKSVAEVEAQVREKVLQILKL